jgi:hypothetical protein
VLRYRSHMIVYTRAKRGIKYHLDTVVIIHRMHGELNASSE